MLSRGPEISGTEAYGFPALRETPDVESSTDAYAARFAGPAGTWLLEVQTRAVLRLLRPFGRARVLDVGGGHAQLAVPLTAAGHAVTVLGSDGDCASRVRRLTPGRTDFVVGDLLDPPFADRSFDVVTSLRILPHVSDWRALLAGLCRVSRNAVLVDFPTPESVNAFATVLFRLKRRIETDTRPFALLRRAEVRDAFRQLGFPRLTSFPQFLLPMVLHRALGRPRVSGALEAACRVLRLTAWLGSPVILLASRREPAAGVGP